jgi:arylsulfatase
VLPLDDRFMERADPAMRPSLIEGRTDFTYYAGVSRVAESCSPNTKNRSHTITAYVDLPADGGEGVLVAAGGVVGGYTLYLKDRKPVYEYNWFTQARYKVTGADPLPVGPCTIRMEFAYDGGGFGKGGEVKLLVNGKQVGAGRVEKTEFARFSADETFDIGCDTGSPVSADYQSPFPFTGILKKVEIKLEEEKLTPEEQIEVRQKRAAAEQARH